MALIIVLVCMALLAVLVVAFLSGASSEITASKQYASSIESQNLASSALNLVMGQVAEAADGVDADGNTLSWASQPGMIRTYTASSGGAPGMFYRLYSSPQMQLPGANFDVTAEAPPSGWAAQPALYTDLNAPAGAGDRLRFPIVDPRADARLATAGREVAGFSYNENAINGAVVPTGDPDAARLPMPVLWLYVLQEGEFVVPRPDSDNNERVIVPGASQSNPIVGRVAFWTDDESAKININTASEGMPWDTPMATYQDEIDLDRSFPVQGEFQRYQGHPATTSLSTVFPWLKGTEAGSVNNRFHAMNPRILPGGSMEGTVMANALPSPIQPGADRLYDTVDELIFDAERGIRQGVSQEEIERRRFFLTAQSRSPETTLFNTPRVAVWPLHENPDGRHAAEKLIAHAASAGSGESGERYYFTRANQFDPLGDFNNRNAELLGYLQELASRPIPGRGTSFLSKWGTAERDQILTQIYDYIRSCINLRTRVHNGQIATSPNEGFVFTGEDAQDNASGRRGTVFPTALPAGTSLGGERALSTDTRGFGRFFTVREVALVFGCEQDNVITSDPPIAITNTTVQFPQRPPHTATVWNDNSPWIIEGCDPADFPNSTNILTGGRMTDGTEVSFDPPIVTRDGEIISGGNIQPGDYEEIYLPYKKIWAALFVELFVPSQGSKVIVPNVAVTVSGMESLRWRLAGPDGPVTRPLFDNDERTFRSLPPREADYPGYQGYYSAFFGVPLLHRLIPADHPMPAPFPGGNPPTSVSTNLPSEWQTEGNWGPSVENWSIEPDSGWFDFLGGTIQVSVDLLDRDGTGTGVSEELQQHLTITFPESENPWPNPRFAPHTYGRSGNNPFGVFTSADYANARNKSIYLNTMAKRQFFRGTEDHRILLTYSHSTVVNHPDVIKSMVAGHGDYRLTAARSEVPATEFTPHLRYHESGDRAYTIRYMTNRMFEGGQMGSLVPGLDMTTPGVEPHYSHHGNLFTRRPPLPAGVSARNFLGNPGDWDNGVGNFSDGPFINKVDEGLDYTGGIHAGGAYGNTFSYLDSGTKNFTLLQENLFGPMRQIASPVMFGSLPTGVKRNRPWETLLFCPNPAAGWAAGNEHPGFGSDTTPPDHLLLDFFWMPVTEPYAISDRFSTAGKVNLNYQMLPFTYIKRDTGIRAVLKNQWVTAFNEDRSINNRFTYKRHGFNPDTSAAAPGTSRYEIDPDETLAQFDERFDTGEIFKSATEICEMFLVPEGFTLAQTRSPTGFWADKRLTGDNMRERPYNAIYPRVTTRSNVFTVYVKAQAVKQIPATLHDPSTANTFTEGRDIVEGEFQTSYTFERYLDPNAPAPASDTTPLGPYKMRVINQRNLSW